MTDDMTTLLARSRTIAEACDPNAWYDVETLTQSLPLGDDGDAAHIRQASPQAWLALLDAVAHVRHSPGCGRGLTSEALATWRLNGFDVDTTICACGADVVLIRLTETLGGR